MKKRLILLIILLLILFFKVFAQERIVSGNLIDSSGEPLPGVNITVKGTNKGTITDINGYYSIEAPLGAVLVFSFVGFMAEEVVVTEKNSTLLGGEKVNTDKPKSIFYKSKTSGIDNMKDKKGVAILSDSTPTYAFDYHYLMNHNHNFPRNIRKIRLSNENGIPVYLINSTYPYRPSFNISWHSSFSVSKPIKLPQLQNEFAQGRSENGKLVWKGPETNEIFSWGPKLSDLEFDGSEYPFDRSGRLVEIGHGAGIPAKVYRPMDIFQDEMIFQNEISISSQINEVILSLDAGQKLRTGILPESGGDEYRFMLKASTNFYPFDVKSSISYSKIENDLPLFNSNYSRLLSSIILTPPSFDNANGYSSNKAIDHNDAFLLFDGEQRSFSENCDNPYWLLSSLPDQQNIDLFSGGLGLTSNNLFYESGLSASFITNYNYSNKQEVAGMPPMSAQFANGYLSERNLRDMALNTDLGISYDLSIHKSNLEFDLNHQLNWNSINYNELLGQGFETDKYKNEWASTATNYNVDKYRTIHEVIPSVKYLWKGSNWNEIANIQLSNVFYFSDSTHYNFLPVLSANLSLDNLLFPHSGLFNGFSIYTIHSNSINESPLFYDNRISFTPNLPLSAYNQFLELPFTDYSAVKPEKIRKFETGIKANTNHVSMEINLYSEITNDAILPINRRLINAGKIKNVGYEITGKLHEIYLGEFSFDITAFFSKSKPTVADANDNHTRFPLAGFNTISTNFAVGKPLGYIYGTGYQKNENGNKIIGPDGFPLIEFDLPLGDPNPAWNSGFNTSIQWKEFDLDVVFDYRKGGKIWNGTKAILDYHGRSKETGQLRNTTNYIFEGVQSTGEKNVVPVNFYDVNQNVFENRWTKNGLGGIAEEYIVDASYFRLKEARLSYQTSISRTKIAFSIAGSNLIFFKKPEGVNPFAEFMANSSGSGLELFNLPLTQTFGTSITIKF